MLRSTPFKWLLVVLGLFAAAMLIQRNERLYTADRGRLAVTRDGDAAVMVWRSAVDAPMARRISEAYDVWGGQVDRFVLEIHSPGGAVAEGRRVIEVLETIKRTHRLDTRVPRHGRCLSMCVPIYLTGEERVAARNSRFMFHEPQAYDAVTGKRSRTPAFERRLIADAFIVRFFENSPMDPQWREGLKREWVGKEVWKSGSDLMRENAGVITRLES